MTTVKRLSSDYLIYNKTSGNVTISTNKLYVDGDMIVGGTSTSVNKTDLDITDNMITLNKGETGTGVTLGTAGVTIDRGLASNVMIRWNETLQRWQLTNDGSYFGNLATANASSVLSFVKDDPNPELAGNLNITGYSLYNTSANVIVYANTVGSGGSGVYVDNTAGNNPQELITKSKALALSILFG